MHSRKLDAVPVVVAVRAALKEYRMKAYGG